MYRRCESSAVRYDGALFVQATDNGDDYGWLSGIVWVVVQQPDKNSTDRAYASTETRRDTNPAQPGSF